MKMRLFIKTFAFLQLLASGVAVAQNLSDAAHNCVAEGLEYSNVAMLFAAGFSRAYALQMHKPSLDLPRIEAPEIVVDNVYRDSPRNYRLYGADRFELCIARTDALLDKEVAVGCFLGVSVMQEIFVSKRHGDSESRVLAEWAAKRLSPKATQLARTIIRDVYGTSETFAEHASKYFATCVRHQ